MKYDKNLVWKTGEEKAAIFLKRKGYRVLESNYRTKLGEIDIITEKDGVIVFFEVKTRTNLNCGLPCESVTSNKQRYIRRVAESYISKNNLWEREQRIDIIEVLLEGETVFIKHIVNAF